VTVTPTLPLVPGQFMSDGPVKTVEEILIYESPDGGKTVYSRKSGDTNRELVKWDDGRTERVLKFTHWRGILDLAETEPSLRDAVQQVEVLYELLRDQRTGPGLL
jgi:hypothetical protein